MAKLIGRITYLYMRFGMNMMSQYMNLKIGIIIARMISKINFWIIMTNLKKSSKIMYGMLRMNLIILIIHILNE